MRAATSFRSNISCDSLHRVVFVLLAPSFLFSLTLCILLLVHGGHRRAILGNNPFCSPSAVAFGPIGSRENFSQRHVFIQVSDLHVSEGGDRATQRNVDILLDSVLPRWRCVADTIVVTGDLVHSIVQQPFPLGSRSEERPYEWLSLNSIARRANESLHWVAVPGNHDSFGDHTSHRNHVSTANSLMLTPEANPARARLLRPNVNSCGLVLLGLDCTLSVPLNKPFNFFGDAKEAVETMKRQLDRMDHGSNVHNVIAFGHYPSALMAHGLALHSIGSHYERGTVKPRLSAYLSGHLHTLRGIAHGGLQVLGRSGVFELQLPDLAEHGAYRVLVLENNVLSFRDFTVFTPPDNPFDYAVFLNPPRAGFCSYGAGRASLSSTHIRVLVPLRIADSTTAELFVDGEFLGVLMVLQSACPMGRSPTNMVCGNVYGVRWSPSKYDRGVHRITVCSEGRQLASHVFSVDGTPEPGVKPKVVTLLASIFLLSDFPSVIWSLFYIGFTLCIALTMPGILRKRTDSILLFGIAVILCSGPVLVARNFVASQSTWGFLTLRRVWLGHEVRETGVDIPYLMSLHVLWGSLVPACLLENLVFTHQAPDKVNRFVTLAFAALYLHRSLSWCLTIAGAYGLISCVISPSGFPLLACCAKVWLTFSCVARQRRIIANPG